MGPDTDELLFHARKDKKIALALFVLLWGTFIYFAHGGGWGPNAQFDLMRAVVEKRTFRIDEYAANTGDWAKVGDRLYINKNPGASFLAVPAYFLLHLLWRDPFASFTGLQIASHFIGAFSFALLAAIAAALLFLFLRFFTSRTVSIVLTLSYALGSMNLSNASHFNTGIIVSSSYIIAAFAIWMMPAHAEKGSKFPVPAVIAGFACGFAVLTEMTAVFGAAILFAVLICRVRRVRAWLWFLAGAVPPLILLACYNLSVTGRVLSSVYIYENPIFRHPDAFMGVFQAPSISVLYWITLHPIRGLIWVSPVLLLTAPGLFFLWKKKETRALAILCGGMIAVYLLFNMSFIAWDGGWCVGPRYLAPAMPFFFLPLIEVFLRPVWRWAAGLLAALSIAIQLVITAVNPWPPPLRGMTNPLTQYIWPVFNGGYVSTNNQTLLQVVPNDPLSLKTFEERWASYNLGEVVGLYGRNSLLPLLFFWAIMAWILVHRRRAK